MMGLATIRCSYSVDMLVFDERSCDTIRSRVPTYLLASILVPTLYIVLLLFVLRLTSTYNEYLTNYILYYFCRFRLEQRIFIF